MKITAFNGTHKTGESNTGILVKNFLQGAVEAGAEVEAVQLADFRIGFCRACKLCWETSDGHCPQNDDMPALIGKFTESDIVVMATPLYVDAMTGLMKTFLDRLIPVGDPHWELDEKGECRHGRRFGKPAKLVAIGNCGYPEQSHFEVLRIFFRRMCRNMHLELAGEIYRGAGGLLSIQAPKFAKYVGDYLALVRQAGREITLSGKISDELSRKIEEPMVPSPGFNELYLKRVNELIDAKTKK